MLIVKNKNWSPGRNSIMTDPFFNFGLHQLLGSDFQSQTPAVNMMENETGFNIELAAPGLAKEDLQINLEKNILTISSEKKTVEEKTNGNYLKREFNYQSFKRSFQLPGQVDIANIKASYENGVLKIELPKKEKNDSPSSRTITIG